MMSKFGRSPPSKMALLVSASAALLLHAPAATAQSAFDSLINSALNEATRAAQRAKDDAERKAREATRTGSRPQQRETAAECSPDTAAGVDAAAAPTECVPRGTTSAGNRAPAPRVAAEAPAAQAAPARAANSSANRARSAGAPAPEAAAAPALAANPGRITWRFIALPQGEGGWINIRDCIRPSDVPRLGPGDADHGIRADPPSCRGPSDSKIFAEMIQSGVDLRRWGVQGIHLGMTDPRTSMPKQAADRSWSVSWDFGHAGKQGRYIRRVQFIQQASPNRDFDHGGAIAALVQRYGEPVERWEMGNNLAPLQSITHLRFAADPRYPSQAELRALNEKCAAEFARGRSQFDPGIASARTLMYAEWAEGRAERVRATCPGALNEFLAIQEAGLEPRLMARVRRDGQVDLDFQYTRPEAALVMGKKEIAAERRANTRPGTLDLGGSQ